MSAAAFVKESHPFLETTHYINGVISANVAQTRRSVEPSERPRAFEKSLRIGLLVGGAVVLPRVLQLVLQGDCAAPLASNSTRREQGAPFPGNWEENQSLIQGKLILVNGFV